MHQCVLHELMCVLTPILVAIWCKQASCSYKQKRQGFFWIWLFLLATRLIGSSPPLFFVMTNSQDYFHFMAFSKLFHIFRLYILYLNAVPVQQIFLYQNLKCVLLAHLPTSLCYSILKSLQACLLKVPLECFLFVAEFSAHINHCCYTAWGCHSESISQSSTQGGCRMRTITIIYVSSFHHQKNLVLTLIACFCPKYNSLNQV